VLFCKAEAAEADPVPLHGPTISDVLPLYRFDRRGRVSDRQRRSLTPGRATAAPGRGDGAMIAFDPAGVALHVIARLAVAEGEGR
jgi:hypothetical protein